MDLLGAARAATGHWLRRHAPGVVASLLGSLVGVAHANGARDQSVGIAGHADVALGKVVALAPNGTARPLTRGDTILAGDRVLSIDGQVRIRFTDGALVWLLPQTELHVMEYRYDGRADGTETAFYGLSNGTIRMTTGAIGRINRSRLQIATPSATIGVRGTGGMIEVGRDGATQLTSTSGIWTLSNAHGTALIPAGTVGTVTPGSTSPPTLQGDSAVNQRR